MAWLVDLLYFIALLVTSPVWIYRLLATGKWRTDWRARFGRCRLPADSRPTLLIHAVSVGEANAIRLLVDLLENQTQQRWRIVIAATTNTGQERARQLFGSRHQVVRYPLDFSWCVRRFLRAVKPDLVALVELEVWPNFVRRCTKEGIPVCVINGRLSQRSYSRYRLIAPLLRSTFARLAAVAAQTREYADRFIGLGAIAQRVEVLDTMKWDAAQIADTVAGSEELARSLGIDRRAGSKPLIVAGSTAPGEDKLLIDTCPPEAQLMIVPRKPEWFDGVVSLAPQIVRRTRCPDGTARPLDGQRLFLLDTIGELRKAYALADVVIVGRSFLGLYGSDMMEPIALGKPTIIGPHYKDFASTMEAFIAGEGIIVTSEPGRVAAELLADPQRARELAQRGRRVILSRQGAMQRHADLLVRLMPVGERRL